MNTAPLVIQAFPNAILHVDGDAFFTSVEQAMAPTRLKGRPVVTGQERGIIVCASYEAKALGIKRGVSLSQARAICPNLVVLSSNYEAYALYARRMFAILRRFSPLVEEYSIDEAFADLGGMRRVFRTSYVEIARRLQTAIQTELDLSVSVGLSLSKSLAKIASNFRKPAGVTVVNGRHIHLLLQRTPLHKVWGFGPNTVQLLSKYGIHTAFDFASQPESWAKRLLGKNGSDIWHELRGTPINPVNTNTFKPSVSISKCRSFKPSDDRDFVQAVLLENLESAFAKLRRHQLKTGQITVILRRSDYNNAGLETRLHHSTASTLEAIVPVKKLFVQLFQKNVKYRTATIILKRLEDNQWEQPDLFENRARQEQLARAATVLDSINHHIGRHAITLGTALFLEQSLPQKETAECFSAPAGKTHPRLRLPALDLGML